MTWLVRTLGILVILAGAFLGIWFSTENSEPIQISLLIYTLPPISSGILLLATLLVGAVVGWLVSFVADARTRGNNLALKRKLGQRDRELERLRKPPAKV